MEAAGESGDAQHRSCAEETFKSGGQELLEIREIEIRGVFVRSDGPPYLRDFQLHRLGRGTVMSPIFLRYTRHVTVPR